MTFARPDGRSREALRRIEIIPNFTKWAEGSVLVSFGDTRVLCTATVEDRIPPWMKDQGRGWITAEYSMLPRATDRRSQREAVSGKLGGRTHEISRLIGRSLRAAVALDKLGERSITLDCDVLQADGGTRTASITGAYVALAISLLRLKKGWNLGSGAHRHQVAAVSLGVVEGQVLLDLCFAEDQIADTDLNLVMTEAGGIVEIQGTAEGAPLGVSELSEMIEVGKRGLGELFRHQREAIERSV